MKLGLPSMENRNKFVKITLLCSIVICALCNNITKTHIIEITVLYGGVVESCFDITCRYHMLASRVDKLAIRLRALCSDRVLS